MSDPAADCVRRMMARAALQFGRRVEFRRGWLRVMGLFARTALGFVAIPAGICLVAIARPGLLRPLINLQIAFAEQPTWVRWPVTAVLTLVAGPPLIRFLIAPYARAHGVMLQLCRKLLRKQLLGSGTAMGEGV